jgi:hypothetical protein
LFFTRHSGQSLPTDLQNINECQVKVPTSSSVKREFLDYIPDVLKPGAGLPDIVLPLEFDEQRAVEVRKAVFKDEVYG